MTLPKLPPQQTPYIYSTDELLRLVESTSVLQHGHSPHVPAIYRTLLLLLYGSGMRIGEAFGLAIQDVDLLGQVQILTVTAGGGRGCFGFPAHFEAAKE